MKVLRFAQLDDSFIWVNSEHIVRFTSASGPGSALYLHGHHEPLRVQQEPEDILAMCEGDAGLSVDHSAVIKAAIDWRLEEEGNQHKDDCDCRLCVALGVAVDGLMASKRGLKE